jgi:L-fuconolactonase
MTSQSIFTRREMLMTTAATAAAAATLPADLTAADSDKDAGWIDAHSHIWPPTADKYPLEPGQTVADLKPPSFTGEELMAIARPEGVRRVVLIQHNVYHGFDNSYLVDAWKAHPDRYRVVGMVDSRKPGSGKAMRKLHKTGVTGFRITPGRLGPDWLDTPGMAEMWDTAAETRQNMCGLINPSDLPGIDAMCKKHPETPVVIDHFARIGVDGKMRKKDIDNLCGLAKYKKATVKISAYYALGKKKPPHDDLIPMIRRLYDAFGPQRLMWASDCPYQLNDGNTYAASVALIRDRIDFLSESDKQWLLRKTAEAVFFA